MTTHATRPTHGATPIARERAALDLPDHHLVTTTHRFPHPGRGARVGHDFVHRDVR